MRTRWNVRITVERNGRTERVIAAHNLTVDGGLEYLRDSGTAGIDTVGYGAGDTAPAHDDTALEDSVFSEAMTLEPVTDAGSGFASITYSHYLGAEAGILGSISEAGLFADTVLIARVTFDAVVKEADTYIRTDWELVFEPTDA